LTSTKPSPGTSLVLADAPRADPIPCGLWPTRSIFHNPNVQNSSRVRSIDDMDPSPASFGVLGLLTEPLKSSLVRGLLRTVIDPDLGENIVDLGLVYGIRRQRCALWRWGGIAGEVAILLFLGATAHGVLSARRQVRGRSSRPAGQAGVRKPAAHG
jgi:Iron-sulfur cluster assembly protein